MSEYVLINWQDRTVQDFSPTDTVQSYIQGVEVGESSDDVSLYRVSTVPPEQVHPLPEPPPSLPSQTEPEPV